MTQPALLIIDVQQGLCEGEGAAFDCAGTIDRINQLAAAARAAGVPVIWIQHEARNELRHGTREWQLAGGLDVQPGDERLRKTTPDSFNKTDLEARLRAGGIDTLIVCGMHTEFCVDTTARRALALGWPVWLAADAHTSAGNAAIAPPQVIAHHNATLSNISSFGPRVQALPAAEVVRRLAGAQA
ncbi:cysteine hydrolase family protein [Ottowia testudinis]|uniref:Cysteine hydrolase n=1 Tax=Ottowia testudinis TaxID=2816950 RepID=A0A975CHZ6_9BURK|nr:cysteine hydrolase family protein [Ottowia testudinis]QTD45431.1 cysteine hydrolase [Ottowia testudinis]